MKDNTLHNIKKTGFKVPKDYFEGLEDSIIHQAKLSEKIEKTGFKTPQGYFEGLEDSILSKTQKTPKVIPLFSKQNFIYAASIAAVLVIMFNVFWNTSNTTTNLEVTDIEQYLLQQDVSDYELATLLTEDDLASDNFVDLDISDESLENYLLEHATLEDLITEQE